MIKYKCGYCDEITSEKNVIYPNSLPWMKWFMKCPHCDRLLTDKDRYREN